MTESAIKPEVHDVLVVKRLFSASMVRVFDAWTKAEVIANWFGPEGSYVSHSEDLNC